MRQALVPTALAAALALAGCGSESLSDATEDAEPVVVTATVAYDPSNGVLPVPNDLLFSGTTDGTLNLPVDDPTDGADPYVALSTLDGWSTTAPFTISIQVPAGITLDTASVVQGVRIFETVFGGPTAPGACAQVPQGAACQVVDELTFGEDFAASITGNAVAVVPLKPLKAKTGYLVVLTDGLKDSLARSVGASATYRLVKQDLATKPLGSPSQRQLQGLINSFEAALSAAGIAPESIIYSGAMTTQSTADALGVARLLMAGELQKAQQGGSSALTLSMPIAADQTSADALIDAGLLDPSNPAHAQAIAIGDTALVMNADLTLPYMLEYPNPTTNCPPAELVATGSCAGVSSAWQALGDSPVTILGALNSGALTAEKVVEDCGLDSAAELANPANLVGCQIVLPQGQLDRERNLTMFNPLPLIRQWQSVPVLITLPNADAVNALRAAQAGIPVESLPEQARLVKPLAGWPTVIFAHGISSSKEGVHAIAGSLAMAGLATIAIDQPLHGERSVDFNNDDIYEISASSALISGAENDPFQNASPLVYANLSSLTTVRDNLRQSASDYLALRAGISYLSAGQAAVPMSPTFDATKVSILGHSLGASAATVTTAIANAPLLDPATGEPLAFNPFALQAITLAMPGGGLAGVLGTSPSLGPLVEAGLTASESFAEVVGMSAEALATLKSSAPEQYDALLNQAYPPFYAQFAFAAQTAIESGDAINYAATLAATTPAIHAIEVVGNGDDSLTDRSIPNRTSPENVYSRLAATVLPLSGTEPLMAQMGLANGIDISTGDGTEPVAGLVRFVAGHHSSLLDPSAKAEAPDPALAAAATTEMQTQVANFHATGGKLLKITNGDLVAPAM
ncbi:MAG: lipase [Gammaproteobacteria bacterium]|nr:lipase [Gammaproteobacteria bacterium]